MSAGSTFLKDIVISCFPKNSGLVSAFGYGSVAVPQHGRSIKNSQLDMVLVVLNPIQWHINNCNKNPSHYTRLSQRFDRFLLKSAVSKWPHPAVYYNPLVSWTPEPGAKTQLIKYGVISLANLLRDLRGWSDLYIAGRLHKPVVWVSSLSKSNEASQKELNASLTVNLRAALAFALLEHDFRSPLLETSLYHSLASISYRGDWRVYFGEDKKKIERLITGDSRRQAFRNLYLPYLLFEEPFKSVFDVRMPTELHEELAIVTGGDLNLHSVDHLLTCLPDGLCALAATNVSHNSIEARHSLAKMSHDQRVAQLRTAAASVVQWSSYRQTVLGLFSAGLSRSVVYSFQKFCKMLASLK